MKPTGYSGIHRVYLRKFSSKCPGDIDLLPEPSYQANIHFIYSEHVVGISDKLNGCVRHEQIEHHRLGLHPKMD